MEKAPFLIVEQAYAIAIEQVIQQIRSLGLQTTLTFDLQEARHAHANCPCPHHGTEQCGCQLIVILIYGDGSRPATLIARGLEGKTWFSFVDAPQQHIGQSMETLLLHTLIPV
ncbi:MAG: hypothetical protein CVU44_22685 [Chloroflexi bacterium HGW-Chloroflexi-6]|nr:MAG: hypothetical protein CVU44_22685 [Chloroflexi bacterium HGW-Chloroflexi-6]